MKLLECRSNGKSFDSGNIFCKSDAGEILYICSAIKRNYSATSSRTEGVSFKLNKKRREMADILSSKKKGSLSGMRPILQVKLTSSEACESDPFFKMIEETLKKEGPALVKKVNAVFAFNVTDGPNGQKVKWLIDVKNGNGSVQKGGQGRADTTFTMKDKDIVKLMKGTLQPQPAFFAGKLKVSGNMGIALKLQQIIPKVPQAKL